MGGNFGVTGKRRKKGAVATEKEAGRAGGGEFRSCRVQNFPPQRNEESSIKPHSSSVSCGRGGFLGVCVVRFRCEKGGERSSTEDWRAKSLLEGWKKMGGGAEKRFWNAATPL